MPGLFALNVRKTITFEYRDQMARTELFANGIENIACGRTQIPDTSKGYVI